ncbi:MAG: folate family ECF transporter S component [Clostridiales bacterium]|jgi:ECF transporter S component (folate family)|nr:folate family ECF transporter S component [Clostridiales bacterium]
MKAKINTRTLVLIALFAAISIILARFFVIYITNSVRISFGNIPIILASLLLGPVAGGLTAAIADILGASLFSPLSWYPPLTISPVIVGVLPALLKKKILYKVTIWRLYIIIFITNLITSIGITTYLLSKLYGTPYFALLPARAPISLAISIIEGIVVYILYKRLMKDSLY